MRWRVAFFLLLAVGWAAAGGVPQPAARKQCRDHYLAGAFRSGVFPLSNGGEVFRIGCEFPQTFYPPLPVATTVKNSLQTPFDLTNEKKTIAYQITEREFLSSIISSAVSCDQQMDVVFPPPPPEASPKLLRFTAETIGGKQHVFTANYSQGITPSFNLGAMGMAGVLHLLPDDSNNFTARISLSPLRCLHHVIADKSCEFEQSSRLHDIVVATTSASELSFSFRTDSPSGSLFQFIQASGGEVAVELVDGYILRSGDLRHPFKLLADGNWHEILIDLKSRLIWVDGKHNSAMSLANQVRGPVRSVRISLQGVISKIQLDGGPWECRKSVMLNVRGNAKPEILRQICQKDQPSYCQCKAPATALLRNGSVPLCSTPDIAKAWTFNRNPRKLTFFYSKTMVRSSVSVLFRSDAPSGLVLFGQRNESGETERFQVEFDGKTMSAGACLNAEGSMPCRSCRIERPTGFGHNQWIRVSLFKHFQYVYLTVDDHICALSPSNDALDRTRMYAGPATSSFLFVGGSYYLKSNELTEVKAELKFEMNAFFDHTSQKPRSLRGCVAEVHVDGQQWDLQKVFNEQTKLLKSPEKAADVFAMQVGCSECTMDCGEFSCRRVGERDVCDCGQQFGVPLSTSARCDNKAEPISLIAAEDASLEYRFKRPVGKRVVKWWIHVLLPNVNDALQPVVTVGDFIISVGDYGRTVLFSAPDYDISEGKQLMEETSDSPDKKDFLVRVDNQTRRMKRLDFSNFDVVVQAIRQTKSTEAVGCVSGIYFAMDGEAEESSSLAFVNVLQDLPPPLNAKRNLTLMAGDLRGGCGVLDPQLWEAGSSSLGLVGDYDPHGTTNTSGFWYILLYAILILLLIGALIAVLVVYRRNRSHKYTVDKKGKEHVNPDERRPLVINGTPPSAAEGAHDSHGFESKAAPKAVVVQEAAARRS
ncbi:Bam-2 [Aphelenchoides fujianensis]|nr:Bam-2 [Aphelenchoides fujianensis]